MKKGSKSSIVAASKATELRVARVYPGGQRLAAGTWVGEGDIDVISEQYAIQVKHRKNVPAYILEGLTQVQEGAADLEEIYRLFPLPKGWQEPLLVIVTKPGSGRPSRMFEIKEVFDND